MIPSLVITLREGVEVAVLMALVLGLLVRAGHHALVPAVWTGFACGLAGSGVLALLAARVPVRGEAFEGLLFLAGGVLVASLALWMRRHGAGLARSVEAGLVRRASAPAGRRLSVGLFVFVCVMREGVETVLFLLASGLSTSGVGKWAGAGAGLLLAAAAGYLLVQGGRRLPLARFFSVTTFLLFVISAQMLLAAFHELSEAGWLPSSPLAMAAIGPAVRYQALFFAALAALPAVLLWRHRALAHPPPDPSGPARRLRAALARRERFLRVTATASAVAICAVVAGDIYAGHRRSVLPPPPSVEARDGAYVFAVAGMEEGRLQRFQAFPAGTDRPLRFLLWHRGAAGPAAALDACEICGDLGYYQDGGVLVCRNCQADVDPATLGAPGGCNPIPLAFEVSGGALRIREADLAAHARRFGTSGERWETDPICGMKVRVSDAIRIERGGRSVYLCRSMDCRRRLDSSAPSRSEAPR